ncbi:hypothetical protein [Sporosarcina ureilytica]
MRKWIKFLTVIVSVTFIFAACSSAGGEENNKPKKVFGLCVLLANKPCA